MKPILFDPQKDRKIIFKTINSSGVEVCDLIKDQLEELVAVRHPYLREDRRKMAKVKESFIKEFDFQDGYLKVGKWVYYQENKKLVHFLDEKEHLELRTSRNRNLITSSEQKIFYNFPVGIAGLSVGSHAALSTVLQGGGKYLKLADMDVVSASNINRLRISFDKIGKYKTDCVAHDIYGLNPYAELTLYREGLTKDTIKGFFDKGRKIKIVVDAIDSIEMKVALRLEARRRKIPVLMATDNGDGVILDVERYDLNPRAKIWSGRVNEKDLNNIVTMTQVEKAMLINKILGVKNIAPRMLSSTREIGKTLYTWPQIGGAAQLAGVVLAYAIRIIANKLPLKNGQTVISLERILSFNKL